MENLGWMIWVAAMVIFGIAEVATVNMVSIWFVGGALAALLVQLLGGGIWVQIIAFFVVSCALLACLRPFAQKYVTPKKTPTNADMAIGRQAYVTEEVDNLRGTGTLKLDGKEWSVRSASGENIPAGTLVKIVKMEGVKLYAEPANIPAEV